MTMLRTLDRVLVKAEVILLVLFLSVMIFLAFSQVVLRNFFGTGILWADPLVRHLLIWAGFLGAAIATHEEKHISIDALSKFFSPRWKAVSQIVTSLFAVIVCYYLADAALTFLFDERDSGSDFVLGFKTWHAILILPAGYWLMGVHFIVKIIENLQRLFGKQDEVKA
jgi:TRAP-type C4-dicarboxylate transport system permease small subunit